MKIIEQYKGFTLSKFNDIYVLEGIKTMPIMGCKVEIIKAIERWFKVFNEPVEVANHFIDILNKEHINVGIIRDLFKDNNWNTYSIYKKGNEFSENDKRDSKINNCFDIFEEYFGSDFLIPTYYTIKVTNEYNQIIKEYKFGENIEILLRCPKKVNELDSLELIEFR